MSDRVAIDIAHKVAKEAHAGQKYGDADYYEYHLKGVLELALIDPRVNKDNVELVSVCALLHDVLEDTETTTEDLVVALLGCGREFTCSAIPSILKLTKHDTLYVRDVYVTPIKRDEIALIVKTADARFNLSNSIREKNLKRIRKYTKLLRDLEEESD